ncbi:MAG: V-type ATPase subunit [Lachnospiraceae bacterium]|nr:V-type ATPase subunit [Lachnospiraceae bacterium]
MGIAASYSGIHAKLKAMEGHLITPEQYAEIASQPSVPEFLTYLKEHTSYATIFEQSDANSLHRRTIETLLPQALYEDFKKIYLFATADQRTYLDIYFHGLEISFLKRCITRVMHDHNIADFHVTFDDFFERHTRFSAEALTKATTMEEISEAMEHTAYAPIFTYLGNNPGSTYADYELAINLHYYANVWKTLNRLDTLSTTDNSDMVRFHYGTQIDLCNLAWIRRAKFNFHIEQDRIITYLIPCHFKLHAGDVKEFINTSSIEEFDALLKETYYGKHYGITNAAALHDTFDRTVETIALKTAKANPYSIASVYSYLITKENEKNRLIRALEGIRYGLDARTILDYMNGGFLT